MIRNSVDLPEPFKPSTPILAPGKNDREMFWKKRQGDVLQNFTLGRHDLADAIHGVNVLRHGITYRDCRQPKRARILAKSDYRLGIYCIIPIMGPSRR
jgi:hypothetical protein